MTRKGDACKLFRKKWENQELCWLRENYRKLRYCEIASKLKRTKNAIKNIIIKKDWAKPKPRWLREEEIFLRRMYKKTKSVIEVGKLMNRTRFSVYCKARRLGILKLGEASVVSNKENRQLPKKAQEYNY
jgi:hypothetical protein